MTRVEIVYGGSKERKHASVAMSHPPSCSLSPMGTRHKEDAHQFAVRCETAASPRTATPGRK